MNPIEQFNSFRLIFDMKCLDCANEDTIFFLLDDLYNSEGDFINKENINCNYTCSVCNLSTFIDFAKLFPPIKIREIYHWIVLL